MDVYVDVLNAFLRPAINVGVASMKFSHFEAFPCLSAGGYSTDKSTANNSNNPQRHPPRNPQLNQQISTAKSTAEAGRYDLSASLGPWAVEIHFRYSTFFHAGFVGPLQTYRCCWGGQHGRACLPRRLSAIMGNRRGIKHRLICLRGEFPKPAGETGRCKMGPEDYFEGSLSR